MNILNTPKARNIVNSFAKDLVELVREGLLEEMEGLLLNRFGEVPSLPAPKAPKRLSAKPRAKALESRGRVRIHATASGVEVLPASTEA